MVVLLFFFKQKTAYEMRISDWSSDVCSSDLTLRDEVTTVEASFWNFFTSADTYDPDRLTFDRELLRRFYLSEGYADFRVVSVVAALAPEQQDFIVTFTVEEGPRYQFGKNVLHPGLRNLHPAALRNQVPPEAGH